MDKEKPAIGGSKEGGGWIPGAVILIIGNNSYIVKLYFSP
jgi:hypothetical protein